MANQSRMTEILTGDWPADDEERLARFGRTACYLSAKKNCHQKNWEGVIFSLHLSLFISNRPEKYGGRKDDQRDGQ
jgi:hypothetical protein